MGQVRGVAWVVCSPPLVVLCAGTMHNTLIFALDTSDVAAGFLAFLYPGVNPFINQLRFNKETENIQ